MKITTFDQAKLADAVKYQIFGETIPVSLFAEKTLIIEANAVVTADHCSKIANAIADGTFESPDSPRLAWKIANSALRRYDAL